MSPLLVIWSVPVRFRTNGFSVKTVGPRKQGPIYRAVDVFDEVVRPQAYFPLVDHGTQGAWVSIASP